MSQRGRRAMLVAALIFILAWRATSSSAQANINLLQNPSFEESYSAQGAYGELITAAGWKAWWIEREGDAGSILRRPECRPTTHYIFANRVKSGEFAQQCFTFYGTHDMGMYQQVKVKPGQLLRFSIWVQVWSTSRDDASVSELPGNVKVSVGIDPTGGTDTKSLLVTWSPEIEAYDQWHFQYVEEVAQSNTVTVFTRSQVQFAVKHNDIYWDEAGLVDANLALSLQLTPIPTATRRPAPTLGPDSIVYRPPATDTLQLIAARFGIDLSRLARSNRVPANVPVRPGVPVVVPGGQARAATRGIYRVEPGETLWSIAAKFQYHPFELAALNRRYGPGIAWPGEQIIVP